jgi:hypothetical protein
LPTGDFGELKTYYISMQVNNNLANNIDLKIRLQNGTEDTRTVAGKATSIVDFLMQSKYQPDDIYIYSVLTGTTTDLVYLNNQTEINLQPTRARYTVVINTGGDSGKCPHSSIIVCAEGRR